MLYGDSFTIQNITQQYTQCMLRWYNGFADSRHPAPKRENPTLTRVEGSGERIQG